MFGRFLEISLHAPDIRESLEFYESLGFVQAQIWQTWPHPYAVLSDGRLVLGLHAAPVHSPSLTFVLPQLAHALERFEQHGVSCEEMRLGEEAFNRACLRDPGGVWLNLLEARTFSPPALEASVTSACGYFTEFGVPLTHPLSAVQRFWELLGFVALPAQLQPLPRTVLTSAALNLALYRTRALGRGVLTFEDDQMTIRLAHLRRRGFNVSDELPENLDEQANGVLKAPEGTRLLLLQSED